VVELSAYYLEVLHSSILRSHKHHSLTDVGAELLIVRMGISGKLDEVVVNPLPLLHFVCLFEINYRWLIFIDSN
jgi:hypothetical protein